jgi:hypothetical protein
MFGKTKKTVRFDLTEDDDLAKYDEILNDPLCRITRELKEQRTETEYTGGDEGSTHTKKFPILIVTYETKERL